MIGRENNRKERELSDERPIETERKGIGEVEIGIRTRTGEAKIKEYK